MSTPCLKARTCGSIPTPPYTAAAFRWVYAAKASQCSTIWAASSRVGASTRARVLPRGLSIRACRMGRRNAAVFPLPVAAAAMTSRPCIRGGMAFCWMGVGVVNPNLVRAWRSLGFSSNFVNGIVLYYFLRSRTARGREDPIGWVRLG